MAKGTISYKDHKSHGADWRNTRDMLPVSTAKNVWTNLQKLIKHKGIGLEVASRQIGTKEGTLRSISEGKLSNELMRKIQKWVKK